MDFVRRDYYFNILPYDPRIIPKLKISLPIDRDDFQRQLLIICPDGEIETGITDREKHLHLFVPIEDDEERLLAIFDEDHSIFQVSPWPKPLTKKIIFWYRRYISWRYRLFCVLPPYGNVAELTTNLTNDSFEELYPYAGPWE
jgi:hypothetical protein